jgi:predicted ester cyclase
MSSSEENKQLVRRLYEEIDKGNFDVIDKLVAEDYLDHNPPPFPGLTTGREGVKQAFKIFWEATPGYHRIEDQIAEGDKVVTRLTSYGKHEGDLPGAPRIGNDLKMTSVTIHRIANGKLVEKWSEKDMIGFLKPNRRNASLILIQPSGPPVASRARRQGDQIGLVTSGIGGLAEMPDLRLQAMRLTHFRSPGRALKWGDGNQGGNVGDRVRSVRRLSHLECNGDVTLACGN